jgi:hypothetical protein
MSDNAGVFEVVEKMACTDVLHRQASCIHGVSHLIRHNLKIVSTVYVPLSLLFLALKNKELTTSLPWEAIKTGFRSGIWLTIWVPSFSAMMCAYYNRYKEHSKLATFVAGFTSGFLAMEAQPAQPLRNRVVIMALNLAIESAYKLLASAGIVKLIPNGECIVFACAMAILSYQQKHHTSDVGPMLQRPMAALEGDSSCEKPAVFITATVDEKLKIPKEFAASPAGYVLSGTLRALFLGLGIGGIQRLLASLKQILSKAPAPATATLPGFLDKHGLALFLATVTFLYRGMRLLTRFPLLAESKWSHLLPGFVAGLGSLFYPSVAISQLCLSQAIDGVWKTATTKQLIVPPRKGRSILFGLATAILFYASVFNKSSIRASALGIFGKLSDGNFTTLPKLSTH